MRTIGDTFQVSGPVMRMSANALIRRCDLLKDAHVKKGWGKTKEDMGEGILLKRTLILLILIQNVAEYSMHS